MHCIWTTHQNHRCIQDKTLKVRREFIQVAVEPFLLPKPDNAADIVTLETPSGKPYHCIPQDPPQDVTGSFVVFNYAVKSPGADPLVESFMLGYRDAGNDFGGSVTCECAALSSCFFSALRTHGKSNVVSCLLTHDIIHAMHACFHPKKCMHFAFCECTFLLLLLLLLLKSLWELGFSTPPVDRNNACNTCIA
jgi:hypothetical protein